MTSLPDAGRVRSVEDLIFKHKVMPQAVTEAVACRTAFFAGKASMVLLSTGSLSFIRENMKTPYDVAFVPKNVRNAAADEQRPSAGSVRRPQRGRAR